MFRLNKGDAWASTESLAMQPPPPSGGVYSQHSISPQQTNYPNRHLHSPPAPAAFYTHTIGKMSWAAGALHSYHSDDELGRCGITLMPLIR